jgi:hypothetical protein
MCGAPLTYLLRKDAVPTAETMATKFDDIDEALVATFSHTIPVFRADTTKLNNMLKPLIIEGNIWSYILPIDRGRNGRLAFETLKQQAKGPAEIEQRKNLAYASLTTKYSAWSRQFSFNDYNNVYQKAFNKLLYLGEQVPKSKKVTLASKYPNPRKSAIS